MDNHTVTIDQDTFPAETLALTDSGHFLDILALSAQCWTENEMMDNNVDWLDENIDTVLKHYNFESAFIAALNSGALVCDKPGKDSDLLPGAFFALNHPENFAESLEVWTDELKEQANECIGQYETDDEKLNAELLDAYDSVTEDMLHDWLHGDRDTSGVLGRARSTHGFEKVTMDRSKNTPDTVTIEVSPEWVDERLDGEEQGTQADALRLVADLLAYEAAKYVKKEQGKRAERRMERERVAKHQAERVASAAAERVAQLNAMKKA